MVLSPRPPEPQGRGGALGSMTWDQGGTSSSSLQGTVPTLLSLWAVSLGGGNCLCGLEQDTFFSSFFNAQMLGEGCGAGSWQGTGEERWPLPTVRMAKVEEHH